MRFQWKNMEFPFLQKILRIARGRKKLTEKKNAGSLVGANGSQATAAARLGGISHQHAGKQPRWWPPAPLSTADWPRQLPVVQPCPLPPIRSKGQDHHQAPSANECCAGLAMEKIWI